MLLRARLTNLCCSLRSVLNAPRHSCIHLKLSSLANSQVSSSFLDNECTDFLPWLERKSGSRISSTLCIGKSSYGRSLFASKIIQTGDCILQVPYSVQITMDNLCPEIRSLISDEVGNIAKLAIVILVEQKSGEVSEWDPYISRLPLAGELHNTIFWSENELEMICHSSVYQETAKLKSQIKRDFLAVSPVFECFPQIFGDFTYTDFMHACALVGSRAWGSMEGLSLIPFADFLNHEGVSEAIVLSDDDKQCSEVVADRDYAPGEQVLISYGKFSNATLMLDFGFTLPYNNHDEVEIQLDIPRSDLLHDMKIELLQQYLVPTTKEMNSSKYSVNTFTIKEVRSARGKGKGVPQSLRAFARILSCTTPQELDDLVMEAAKTDGRLARRPLNNINKEIQAHLMLSSLFTQLSDQRIATIKSLDSLSPSIFPVRKQMALDLLGGEVRILKSASTWLENYCSTLRLQSIEDY
ncbi:hypothetical protein L6164_005539 [Bauhinia variegata]|uniref:Uncharacterized protein n=1 Tax=Bauhinia variegata TaxID=167791 RepID=A0ACB9PRH0_BAUVA|nr:hypothetical protein L6164_005539 [Bauhinia variegata]